MFLWSNWLCPVLSIWTLKDKQDWPDLCQPRSENLIPRTITCGLNPGWHSSSFGKTRKHVRQDLGLLYGAERENFQDANLFECEVASTVPRSFSSVPPQMREGWVLWLLMGTGFPPLGFFRHCPEVKADATWPGINVRWFAFSRYCSQPTVSAPIPALWQIP